MDDTIERVFLDGDQRSRLIDIAHVEPVRRQPGVGAGGDPVTGGGVHLPGIGQVPIDQPEADPSTRSDDEDPSTHGRTVATESGTGSDGGVRQIGRTDSDIGRRGPIQPLRPERRRKCAAAASWRCRFPPGARRF